MNGGVLMCLMNTEFFECLEVNIDQCLFVATVVVDIDVHSDVHYSLLP